MESGADDLAGIVHRIREVEFPTGAIADTGAGVQVVGGAVSPKNGVPLPGRDQEIHRLNAGAPVHKSFVVADCPSRIVETGWNKPGSQIRLAPLAAENHPVAVQ